MKFKNLKILKALNLNGQQQYEYILNLLQDARKEGIKLGHEQKLTEQELAGNSKLYKIGFKDGEENAYKKIINDLEWHQKECDANKEECLEAIKIGYKGKLQGDSA